MIEGALILLGGIILGRLSRPTRNKTVKPQCGCLHHLAMHDPDTGQCHAQVSRWTGDRNSYHQCTCKQYTGPKPVESYFASPTLPPAD